MKKFLSFFLATTVVISAVSFLSGCKPAAASDEVVALRVSETPTTVQYDVNDPFSAVGGKIKVVYGDPNVNYPNTIITLKIGFGFVVKNIY